MDTRKQEAIEAFQTFYQNHGKPPSYNACVKDPTLRTGGYYANLFGSFNAALEAAGLPLFWTEENGEKKNSNAKRNNFPLCVECGVNQVNHRTAQFCSLSCSGLYNSRKRGLNKRPKVLDCGICNTSFKPLRSTQFLCSSECKGLYEVEKSKVKFEEGKLTNNKAIRVALTRIRGYHCEECGISEWREKPILLEVDHINGDPDNNFPENVRLLCLNCHSQTPTFRRGNLNGPKCDRRSKTRRKMYWKKKEDPN